jgi:O-antigen/teichoic acid export membrane protein
VTKRQRGDKPVARTSALLLAGNLALGVFGFASGLLANDLLEPAGRGQLASIQTVPQLISLLAILGLPEAVIYFGAGNRGRTPTLLGTALVLTVVGSVVGMLVGLAVMPLLLHRYDSAFVHGALLYLLVIPLLGIVTLAYQPLRAVGAFGWWVAFRVALSGGWVGVLLVAWATGMARPVPVAVMHLVLLGALGVAALIVVHVVVGSRPHVDRTLAPTMLRYGVPSALTNLPQTLNLRLDQMVMTAVLPARQLGLYAASVGWSWMVAPPLHTIAQVVFPHLAALPHDERGTPAAEGARLAMCAAIVVMVLALLVTPVLLPLLLPQYRSALFTAELLLVAGTISGFNLVLEEVLRGLGHPRDILVAEIGGLVVTGASLAALLGRYGITGAAWSSIAGYSTLLVILVRLVARRGGLTAGQLLVPRRADLHAARRRIRAIRDRRLATPVVATDASGS